MIFLDSLFLDSLQKLSLKIKLELIEKYIINHCTHAEIIIDYNGGDEPFVKEKNNQFTIKDIIEFCIKDDSSLKENDVLCVIAYLKKLEQVDIDLIFRNYEDNFIYPSINLLHEFDFETKRNLLTKKTNK